MAIQLECEEGTMARRIWKGSNAHRLYQHIVHSFFGALYIWYAYIVHLDIFIGFGLTVGPFFFSGYLDAMA